MKWLSGGICFLIALWCGYGFLASGELSGSAELMWKTGYATLGLFAFCGAVYAVAREPSRSESE